MWSSGAIALRWIRRASSGSGASARAAAAISDRISGSGSIHQLRDVARWSSARPRSACPSSPDRRAAATTDRRFDFLAGRSRAAERERHDPRLAAVLECPHIDRFGLGERCPITSVRPISFATLGGAQKPRATRATIGAQGGRPLERGNRYRQRAAPDRTFGRGVEERGDRLVGRVGRGRAMPGRAIDVAHDARQRVVGGTLFLHRRPLLDRRPDERMAEAKRGAVDLDESRVDRRRDRRCRNAGRSHDLRDPVAIVERGDQQEPLRVGRKIIRARRKRALEARVEREDVARAPRRKRRHRGSSRRARRARGGSRQPPGGSGPAPTGRVPARVSTPCPARRVAQRLKSQLVDAGRIERRFLALAKPHHHRERIGVEAAGDEGERIGRWAVEPLDVVGDNQDRRADGRVRQQRERCEGDEERVLGRSLDEAERHAERRVLWLRQRLESAQDGSKQLVETGERQVCLGPDAGRLEDSHTPGPGQHDGPFQERRLADPRIAADQQRSAAGRRLGDEGGDDLQLPVPAEDPFANDHATTGLSVIAAASSLCGTVGVQQFLHLDENWLGRLEVH